MKTHLGSICVCWLLPAGLLAAAAGPAPAELRPAASGILSLAPADADFVAYADGLRRTLDHPIFKDLRQSDGGGAVVNSLARMISRDAMFAFSGSPMNPMSWSFTLGAGTDLDRATLMAEIQRALVPAWNNAGLPFGTISAFDDGTIAHVDLVGPTPVSLHLALRNGTIYASSKLDRVERFLAGEDAPAERFLDGGDFKRLVQDIPEPWDVVTYLDVRELVPMAVAGMNNDGVPVGDALEVGKIEFVGVVAGRTPADATRTEGAEDTQRLRSSESSGETERKPSTGIMRFAAGLTDRSGGLWAVIDGDDRPMSLAGCFPSSTLVLIGGKFENGRQLLDRVRKPARILAPEILQEFDTECDEWSRELKVDPRSFLANLGSEWALGMTARDEWVGAVRLINPGEFEMHYQLLRRAFGLGETLRTYREFAIRRADRERGVVYFTVADDVLLISASGAALKASLDALSGSDALTDRDNFRAATSPNGRDVAAQCFVDLPGLKPIILEDAGQDAEMVDSLIDGLGSVGMTLVGYDRLVGIDLSATNAVDGTIPEFISSVVGPSVLRSRQLAERTRSMANVKGMITAARVYEADHQAMPDSLDQLIELELITPSMRSPDYGGGMECTYLYRLVERPAADTPVICESAIHHGGLVVGFGDGHVEWVEGERAQELLALFKQPGTSTSP